jgi:uncharacterized caspase-like protein
MYAVCIGISDYRQAKMKLINCRQDAKEMYALLQKQAPDKNLVLLTDNQATEENIVKQTADLFKKASSEDIVIFFFSGHGDKGCFVAYDKRLYFNSIRQIFKQTKAKRKIILADACYSGTLRSGENSNRGNGKQSVGSNVLLFLSSRSNQTSIDDPTLRNGMFTFFLLAGLKGGADANKDRKITARELFDFVNPKVKEKSGGTQSPVMWGKFDENLIWAPLIFTFLQFSQRCVKTKLQFACKVNVFFLIDKRFF